VRRLKPEARGYYAHKRRLATDRVAERRVIFPHAGAGEHLQCRRGHVVDPCRGRSHLRPPSGRPQRVDRRDLDEFGNRPRQLAVGRDENVSLQLRKRDEFGVGGCLPPQLIRNPPRRSLSTLSPRKRTFSELTRVTRSIPSAAEISLRRAASYSVASACERTRVGASSLCSAATSISPAAIRSSVSQSTTKRVTPQTLYVRLAAHWPRRATWAGSSPSLELLRSAGECD